MTVECVSEHLFADRFGSVRVHLVETRAEESGLVHFDNEGTHLGCVAVMVGIEVAKLGFDERMRQRFEAFGGSKPSKAVG
jgi:hypothetical protein